MAGRSNILYSWAHSTASDVWTLVKNCDAAPAPLAGVSLSFSGWGFQNVGHGHSQIGLVTSSVSAKVSLGLRFFKEFHLNWESKSEGAWKWKWGSFPEQLEGNTCELFQFINVVLPFQHHNAGLQWIIESLTLLSELYRTNMILAFKSKILNYLSCQGPDL